MLETTPGYGKPRFRILLPTVLITLVTFITVAYVYSGNPVFHQVAYGLIQLVSTTQIVYLLNSQKTKLTKEERFQIKRIFAVGSALFLTAFAIWK